MRIRQRRNMKCLVIFSVFVSCCAANALSLVPGDNGHYVEGESQYIWMGNAEGDLSLEDLHSPVQTEILFTRNGAHNQYWLYTRSNPTNHQVIAHGDPNTIWSSNYLSSRPLKVIVHGWRGDGNNEMNTDITSAFLEVSDCNVIVVDWRALANKINYVTSVVGVPSVGQHLGNFLSWLLATTGGDWNQVHLIGFSLGAHVVGNAGRQTGGRPNRITGLDPAGPLWTRNTNALDKECGQYVEAIHTDGNIAGIFKPVGHADFYPNGGKNPQPGCLTSLCSHGRATKLFASTIRYNHLVGRSCPNIFDAEMGNCNGAVLHMGNAHLEKHGYGIFGLRTARSWPF